MTPIEGAVAGWAVGIAALAVVFVAVSYAREWWPRLTAWARWRAARPRFDPSAAFRRELAIWKEQRP